MELLLHGCCAPCSTYSVQELSKDHELTLFWYNPNIQPYQEYKSRKKSFIRYVGKIGIRSIIKDEYLLENFLEGAMSSKNRCEYCYRIRLQETAKTASQHGLEAFSTTLTISPYQNHELIKKIGDEMGDKYSVNFIYKDLRDGFRKSHDMARELELYLQAYCGCIFSEQERYEK